MALSPGSRIGSYEIGAQIGVGGMGEVYRATDTKLKRDVAIKVLPDAVAADTERLARFQREAEVLASLNHPNIAAIYGLEEADASKALVMELVEGPTLADRLASGAIPVEQALKLGLQIAEALEAAHEQAIVHRDLKPANIKVTPSGQVKVLDFGLAKAFEAEPASPSVTNSPTLSLAATQAGIILGTAGYMAPEQARGEPADRRADVWAFAVVLFEMLTGQTMFDGRTVSDVLAGVLRADPEWERLPANLHPRVRAMLERCLAREVRSRYQGIADARVDIEAALADPGGVPVDPSLAPVAGRRPVLPAVTMAAALAVVAALATGVAVWRWTRSPAAAVVRFPVTMPEDGRIRLQGGVNEIAISPDGSRVVYASGTNPRTGRLYVRPVGELEATVIRGSEGGVGPFFSPDGESVGFIHQGSQTLKQVSVLGGPAVTITSVDSFPRGVTWGPGDTVVFATQGSQGLLQVPAGGGEAEQLTSVTDGEGGVAHWWPSFLPNGKAVLFTAWSGATATSRIAVLDLESREITYLVSGGSHPHYVGTGHIVYGVDGTLRAVGFDPESLTLTGGNPRPVVEGVLIRDSGAANYSVSDNGTLVYVSGSAAGVGPEGTLVWVDGTGQAERIDAPPALYRSVAMSPDGTRLALEIGQLAQSGSAAEVANVTGTDVWTHDLGRGNSSKITTDPGDDSSPLWTPDGRQIVFASNRGGTMGLYRRSADGSGSDEPIYLDEDAQDLAPMSWASDGDVLIVGRRIRNQNDVMRLAMNGEGMLEPIFDSEFSEERADISPGGDRIAYGSARSDQMEIYVERFPELGERETVSFDGGAMPRWSHDGRELYFLEPETGHLMVVDVTPGGTFEAGRPRVFAEGPFDSFRYRSLYDVAPGGDRVVAISPVLASDEDEAQSQITVVLNWFEELRRLAPLE